METVEGYRTKREVFVPFAEQYLKMSFAYNTLDLSSVTCPVILFHTKSDVCYTQFKNIGYFTLPKDVLDLLLEEAQK